MKSDNKKTSGLRECRYVTALAGLLLAATVAVLYSGPLRFLLIYMEQHRLFRFSGDYLSYEVHQAGVAKVAGDFIVQFFYHPVLGAVILGLLFWLLFATVADGLRRVCRLPVWLAVIAGMIMPCVLLAQGGNVDSPIEPLIVSVVYGMAFWIICFIAGKIIDRKGRKPAVDGTNIRTSVVTVIIAAVMIGGATLWCITKSYVGMEKDIVMIEEEYRRGDDAAVLARADRYLGEGGRVHVIPYFRNLSLLRQGRLAEHFLDYPPLFGVKSMYVEWDSHVLKREYGYHVYELLGHINGAQRWQWEAMSNYGETGRNLQDMAAYNIINGRDKVAMRDIAHLRQSLFYREAADSLLACVGWGKVPGRRNFFAEMPDSVERFSYSDMPQESGYMNSISTKDPIVREYFLVSSLLSGNLQMFFNGLTAFGMRNPEEMPPAYREALAMLQVHNPGPHWAAQGFGRSEADINRYRQFLDAKRQGNNIVLKSNYGRTYWYYFNYINPDRPRTK